MGKNNAHLFAFDASISERGTRCIAGADEAGRGPWAGPVVAAVVILPYLHDYQSTPLADIHDSKKLSPKKRDVLYDVIIRDAVAYSIGVVDHVMIDSLNILEATKHAIRQCLTTLSVQPQLLLVDGSIPIGGIAIPQQCVIRGDSTSACVAAASILAKVTRDRIMETFDTCYPEYGFRVHKGYGTALHQEKLKQFGPCPIHRKSFAPIKQAALEANVSHRVV